MEFIWLYLPLVFIVSRLLPKKAMNAWLLLTSLFFYAFGEPVYILLLLLSITVNYFFGTAMAPLTGMKRKLVLAASVFFNLLLLGYYKYSNFAVRMLNLLTDKPVFNLREIALPIGISFFTFQIMSYIIDLYREQVPVQKNPFKLGLYISFFPQLIAGPIVYYRDIEAQLSDRAVTPEKTAYGIKRFIWGLAKKTLIANNLAVAVDNILALNMNETPSSYLWLAYLMYALQIYYDFSGYSDMAIGLGKLFGFTFLENFNYPYIAASVSDFWRRWHISLSGWFRDYLYIPLGGNRKGGLRTALNLLIVFALTGVWHGAGLNFIVWGMWHGVFMLIERFFPSKTNGGKHSLFLGRLYTLGVVYFGWIFFRAGSLTAALTTVIRMFSFSPGSPDVYFQSVGNPMTLVAIFAGVAASGLIQHMFPKLKASLYDERDTGYWQIAALTAVFVLSILSLVSGSYNPFIYFRF